MSAAIEYGVPIPPKGRPPNASKWKWHEMEVGGSFFAAGYRTSSAIDGDGPILNLQYPRTVYPDWEMTVRMVVEDGVRGVRVWRLK